MYLNFTRYMIYSDYVLIKIILLQRIAENTTVKRSSAISKHVSFWAGQIPAGQTSPKGTISEMAARAFYCCLYAIRKTNKRMIK